MDWCGQRQKTRGLQQYKQQQQERLENQRKLALQARRIAGGSTAGGSAATGGSTSGGLTTGTSQDKTCADAHASSNTSVGVLADKEDKEHPIRVEYETRRFLLPSSAIFSPVFGETLARVSPARGKGDFASRKSFTLFGLFVLLVCQDLECSSSH